TIHVPVPVHPLPLQPPKVEPAVATAISVTEVPLAYSWVQSFPQEMPPGVLVTDPLPVPAFVTVS
ncbi:MAG TPA: hypothetical protein DD706_12870, partial [Nitrospiraceae bacterium]|nr:hypothetical protein [Nitrospiraceae bacterium]